MTDEREGISHLVNGDKPTGEGVEVTAICGFTFISKGKNGLPVCNECVSVVLDEQQEDCAMIGDLYDRLAQIADALNMKDELGQHVWLHHVAEEKIANAFWRPGPARFEGPTREDGSF